MAVKAQIALIQNGNQLIYAGRGYQPKADFNKGDIVGEYVDYSANNNEIQIKTQNGKVLKIKHTDYYEE